MVVRQALKYSYSFDETAGNCPSFLQIVRNYEAAAKRIGGAVLSDDVRRTTIRIAKGGQETWVALEAFNEGRVYELNIIEGGQMQQDVVADAAALRAGLKESGHVEVPGIFFDFGKAELKPGGRATGEWNWWRSRGCGKTARERSLLDGFFGRFEGIEKVGVFGKALEDADDFA